MEPSPARSRPGPIPRRWSSSARPAGTTTAERSTNLTADAAKGANSITVASAAGLQRRTVRAPRRAVRSQLAARPGGPGTDLGLPGLPRRLAAPQPGQGTDDPFPDAAGWFSRQDRPTNEIKQIDHISGNTIFFNTPVHISYRTSHTAQLTAFGYAYTQNAGRRGPHGHRR